MTTNAERFDHWIRGTFAELNTQLEERYFAQADRAVVTGVGEELKTQLRAEGNDHVARLLAEVHPPLADCLAVVWWRGAGGEGGGRAA